MPHKMGALAILVLLTLAIGGVALAQGPQGAQPRAYVALVIKNPRPTQTPDPCQQPIPGATYGSLAIEGSVTDRPAEGHADLNLALRGYTPASGEYVGLLDNCSAVPDDWKAPQLRGLFGDHRRPTFTGVYWVHQWDWGCNCRSWDVERRWGPSFATLGTASGEILYVPDSGYTIDAAQNYETLVLYAAADRITLKYTREDNVVRGYTLHLENVCVDPALLTLYASLNAQGRAVLPALQPGRPFARARGSWIGLSIRDSGEWMDPRHCADWWRQ
jgi:hypothetical protein